MSTIQVVYRTVLTEPSLPEVHAGVSLSRSPFYWRRLLGFWGPGFPISVGYMDPGNWATGISSGGSGMGAPDIEANPEKLAHKRQAGM